MIIFSILSHINKEGKKRVGGVSYECAPKELIGINPEYGYERNWRAPRADKKYTVGGWASINPKRRGPIYDVLEEYITRKKIIRPSGTDYVKVTGVS